MEAEKVTRRLREVSPGAMPEVLRVAADLYARDQTELAQAEERQKFVEATEEAGLPAEYLERAAALVLARQGTHTRRRRRGALLAGLGLALAIWGGRGLSRLGEQPAPPASLSPPVATVLATPAPAGELPGAVPLEGAGWSAEPAGTAVSGLTPVNVGDGVPRFVTREGRRCLTTQPGTDPPSIYLYFDVEDARTRQVVGPVWVAVEYLDAFPDGRLALEYDSATGNDLAAQYRWAEERSGAVYHGSRTWRTAFFRLEQPLLANRQNAHTDFRLALEGPAIEVARKGWPLFVRSLRLTQTRPAEWIRDDG
jgi:hypothetical protein